MDNLSLVEFYNTLRTEKQVEIDYYNRLSTLENDDELLDIIDDIVNRKHDTIERIDNILESLESIEQRQIVVRGSKAIKRKRSK